ncbi:hypothetical protein PAAG_06794 [Paracoccidioides lutzii Pb01]|uniref:Uncharacterized protein n=1 Tax=Paracoccidioides lutzii (strain ATCC MYA-826 / Pb01) TaxID=502779 RepID=C1H7Q3_PARBA|nr:hypothetical protein PAAG_06794 [Paracoccidioides lutzii Pb01]EEH36376.2 hypothetical protein PAAG_06794 [Paracoccidioides lutzii Pb01]
MTGGQKAKVVIVSWVGSEDRQIPEQPVISNRTITMLTLQATSQFWAMILVTVPCRSDAVYHPDVMREGEKLGDRNWYAFNSGSQSRKKT